MIKQSELRKMLAISVGAQEFCLDVMIVREIRGWSPATPLPRTPPYVVGMVNLRGAVIPVIDLAARMGFAPAQPGVRHVIVVTEVGDALMGLLVDGVTDTIEVNAGDVQPTPAAASESAKALVSGIIAQESRLLAVLTLEELLAIPELAAA
jgi:purine-binding chemotaxis protein CheW